MTADLSATGLVVERAPEVVADPAGDAPPKMIKSTGPVMVRGNLRKIARAHNKHWLGGLVR